MDPVTLLGGVLGSVAGSALAGGDDQPDIGQQITSLVNKMNTTIGNASQQAQGVMQGNTQYAMDAVNRGSAAATNAYSTANYNANQQASLNAIQGLQSLQSSVSPYIAQGNNAYDAYMDSLGLSRPSVGTNAIYQAQNSQSMNGLQTQMLNDAFGGKAATNPGAAPTTPTLAALLTGPTNPNSVANAQTLARQAIASDPAFAGLVPQDPDFNLGMTSTVPLSASEDKNQANLNKVYANLFSGARQNYQNSAVATQAQNTAIQQQNAALQNSYNTQLGAYNTNLNTYNQYNNLASLLTPGATQQQQSLLSMYGLG